MDLCDKPISAWTAADLMSRYVITIPATMSLRSAGRLLWGAQVSGAPVVDELGRCVGVLSTTDFLKLMQSARPTLHDVPPAHMFCDWQVQDLAELPEDRVSEFMTPDPVTVAPDCPLAELAHRMLDAHIHRVVIIDTLGRPSGIVSTTDILAAVARLARHELQAV